MNKKVVKLSSEFNSYVASTLIDTVGKRSRIINVPLTTLPADIDI